MAFIVESSNTISFAEYSDVSETDPRLFDSHDSLTDDTVETACIRATTRILDNIKNTDWWQSLYVTHNGSVSRKDIPKPDPDNIKDRTEDFTDLCVYWALSDYILPGIADFGDDDSNERKKMGYYRNRADRLFQELINSGDWYDFDGDSTIETDEKASGNYRLRRIR
tara:strand:+ start:870 stop:1370 length:501 start_codon:yes stop_codon:yes gene_type:complete